MRPKNLTRKYQVIVQLVILTLAAVFFANYPAHAATLTDGTWTQSGSPGTTTITFVTHSGIGVGDKIVLTFPSQATINATGTNITMSGQTAPLRGNDITQSRIVVTADTFVPPLATVTIGMTDALDAYNSNTFVQQSLAISHTTASDVLIDSGLATIFNRSTTITAIVPSSSLDSDGDGIPDYMELGDRDGDGIPDYLDYDPSGYIYDERNGQIVAGGFIEVSGPGAVDIIQDGSSGYYQWFTDGTPGVYVVTLTPPPEYALSESCLPTPGPFDPTGGPVSGIFLGYDRVGTTEFLPNNDCTTHYYTFDLVGGDPFIYHNNYPLRNLAALSDTGTAVRAIIGVGLFLVVSAVVVSRTSRSLARAKINSDKGGRMN